MAVSRNPIFRDKALKHYAQGRRKDILPHFSSIPVAAFVWILLVFLIATAALSWYVQVPLYTNGSGLVLGTAQQKLSGSSGATAVGFFAPGNSARLRNGLSVRMQLGADSLQFAGTIARVEPATGQLALTLKRAGVSLTSLLPGNQVAMIALIRLDATFPVAHYANQALILQVNVGTQSLFLALAEMGNLMGSRG